VRIAQAIEDTRSGTIHYFTRRDDSRAAIVVVSDRHGGVYPTTPTDNTSRALDRLPVSTM